jgi:hypothetical protein
MRQGLQTASLRRHHPIEMIEMQNKDRMQIVRIMTVIDSTFK